MLLILPLVLLGDEKTYRQDNSSKIKRVPEEQHVNRWELIHYLCHRGSYSRAANVTISITIGAAGIYVYHYLSLFRCSQLNYPMETSMHSNLNSIAYASWVAARAVDSDGGEEE